MVRTSSPVTTKQFSEAASQKLMHQERSALLWLFSFTKLPLLIIPRVRMPKPCSVLASQKLKRTRTEQNSEEECCINMLLCN